MARQWNKKHIYGVLLGSVQQYSCLNFGFGLTWPSAYEEPNPLSRSYIAVFQPPKTHLNTNFIYLPQEIHLCLCWGPFEHLYIYLSYGLRKLGFKNNLGNRAVLSPENFYHGWWWWMVDGGCNKFSSFFIFILIFYIAHIQLYYIKLYNFL